MLAWLLNLNFAASPLGVHVLHLPGRIAAAAVRVPGAAAGRCWTPGLIAGEVSTAGAAAGSTRA